MSKVSVRFSDEEQEKLEELMGQQPGATASDVIRSLFRAHYNELSIANALAEIKGEIKKVSSQQGGSGSSKEVTEILRIVRIIASTMPAASKQL